MCQLSVRAELAEQLAEKWKIRDPIIIFQEQASLNKSKGKTTDITTTTTSPII